MNDDTIDNQNTQLNNNENIRKRNTNNIESLIENIDTNIKKEESDIKKRIKILNEIQSIIGEKKETIKLETFNTNLNNLIKKNPMTQTDTIILNLVKKINKDVETYSTNNQEKQQRLVVIYDLLNKKIENYNLEIQNQELKNEIDNKNIKKYLTIGEDNKNLWDISWKSDNLKFMNKKKGKWDTFNTLSLNQNGTVSINSNNYSGTSEQVNTLHVWGTIKADSTIYSENIITNAKNWNDSSMMEFVEFNNNNVLFKNGFLVDDLSEKLKQTRDAELLIRKNGIYQSTSLKGNFSIDSTGKLSIKTPFITNKDFKQGTLKMDEKLDIEKTKLSGSKTIELKDNELSLKLDGLIDTIQDKHIKPIDSKSDPKYKGIDIQKTNLQLSKDFAWSSSNLEKKLNDTLSIQPNFIRNKSATSQTLKGDLTIDGALTII